jgi:SAM-dependent methyltransferase
VDDELTLAGSLSLDAITATLSPEAYYLSPGGRRFLIAAALIAGLPRGARVLDVGCGLGPAAVDLAEGFACRVAAFDSFAPYLDVARQTAAERGVASLVTFRELTGREPLSEFRHGAYDVVLGLGGALSDTIPGGLAAGMAAAAAWLSPGGILICGDVIAAAAPSELMQAIFGETLQTESGYFDLLDEFGFDLIFAARATRSDWDHLGRTMTVLSERSVALRPPADPDRARMEEVARTHPEVAFLNVVARRRPE